MYLEPPSGAGGGLCSFQPREIRQWIPEGDAGTFATLDAMEALVRMSRDQPLTRDFAARIMGSADGSKARVVQLRAWLRKVFRFAPDPHELELVVAPALQLCRYLQSGHTAGDCDDLAVLAAALGASAGLPPRFVVIALEPNGPFEHVWAELWTGQEWSELDLVADVQGIRPAQPGARRAVKVLRL